MMRFRPCLRAHGRWKILFTIETAQNFSVPRGACVQCSLGSPTQVWVWRLPCISLGRETPRVHRRVLPVPRQRASWRWFSLACACGLREAPFFCCWSLSSQVAVLGSHLLLWGPTSNTLCSETWLSGSCHFSLCRLTQVISRQKTLFSLFFFSIRPQQKEKSESSRKSCVTSYNVLCRFIQGDLWNTANFLNALTLIFKIRFWKF